MKIADFFINLLAAIGGLGGIQWAVRTWMYRKTEKRKQEVEASEAEMEKYHKQVEWFQKQLQDCYAQMEQLHNQLRDSQMKLDKWIRRFNLLETSLREAEKWSCNKRDCLDRQRNETKKTNDHEKD